METEKITKCLICGNNADLLHSGLPGYQEPTLYRIYRCSACDTTFSYPRVESDKIYEYIYKKGETVPGYNRYWKYLSKIKRNKTPLAYLSKNEDTYWAVREAISSFITDKSSVKILEIGCGLGYLTYSLRCAGYNVLGIDISETAVLQATRVFGKYFICANLLDFAKCNSESFDVVILTEVIEHVDKPLNFIESIKQLLKPSGRAIITTPNKSLYPSDIIWATDLPPVHVWWFSEDSIRFIGNIKNLDINFINFRKYYQKNPVTIDLRKIRTVQRYPVLDCNGQLVDRLIRRKNNLWIILRSCIYRIVPIKIAYNYLLRIAIKDYLICNERGEKLCAIMQKR